MKRAFSLIELIIGMAIFGVVLTVVLSLLLSVSKSNLSDERRNTMEQAKNNIGVELTNAIRWSAAITLTPIDAAGNNEITVDGKRYRLEAKRILKGEEPITPAEVEVTKFKIVDMGRKGTAPIEVTRNNWRMIQLCNGFKATALTNHGSATVKADFSTTGNPGTWQDVQNFTIPAGNAGTYVFYYSPQPNPTLPYVRINLNDASRITGMEQARVFNCYPGVTSLQISVEMNYLNAPILTDVTTIVVSQRHLINL